MRVPILVADFHVEASVDRFPSVTVQVSTCHEDVLVGSVAVPDGVLVAFVTDQRVLPKRDTVNQVVKVSARRQNQRVGIKQHLLRRVHCKLSCDNRDRLKKDGNKERPERSVKQLP